MGHSSGHFSSLFPGKSSVAPSSSIIGALSPPCRPPSSTLRYPLPLHLLFNRSENHPSLYLDLIASNLDCLMLGLHLFSSSLFNLIWKLIYSMFTCHWRVYHSNAMLLYD
ncbi:unnamed protein product [Cuscuta campestris]|uniref:Uncharacterized protein n=1 Tax=Cuscuta campestris TaxID=132261 RepID=A0A484K715_9ASTE|nr:unnamed protein product [Cuscuta campestris]